MKKYLIVIMTLFLVGCTTNNKNESRVSSNNEALSSTSNVTHLNESNYDDLENKNEDISEPTKKDIDYINEIKEMPLNKLVGSPDIPADLSIGDFFNTQYFTSANWEFSQSADPGCEVLCTICPNPDATVQFRFYTTPTLEFNIEKGQYYFGKYQWEHEVLLYNGGYGQTLTQVQCSSLIKQWLQEQRVI